MSRLFIGGSGFDTTAAVDTLLRQNSEFMIKDLYIIGNIDEPTALFLTNYDRPVVYSLYPGVVFMPATIKRGGVKCSVGLDVQTLAVTWTPPTQTPTVNTTTASYAQLAALHFYDNKPLRILRCVMPTPGDANTLGCCDWFGGRINNVVIERNQLTLNVSSYLDVVTQKVPSTVIEVTNTLAGTTAVTIPVGNASIPTFACFTGSTQSQILADCLSPTALTIYSNNLFAGGYMVFLSGVGATLAGAWAAIAVNNEFTDGHGNHHSQFEIYGSLPWPPTPTVDTFYVSMAPPINLGDEVYFGFPFVPNPQTAA